MPKPFFLRYIGSLCCDSQKKLKRHWPVNNITWLESPIKYIPISCMSPNHVRSGASPGLIFSPNCLNPFVFFQGKVTHKEKVKSYLRSCPKKSEIFIYFRLNVRMRGKNACAEKTHARTKSTRAHVFVHISSWNFLQFIAMLWAYVSNFRKKFHKKND